MEREPFVRVLGSADWLPTPDNDGASYVIDDRILIDTGWSAAVNMINHGMDPTNIDTICFTHMHADHYIGLTQMLLHRRIRCGTLEGLTILGPAPTVRAGFERAFAYIFHDSYDVTAECKGLPLIVPLHDGDGYETEHYRISTRTMPRPGYATGSSISARATRRVSPETPDTVLNSAGFLKGAIF